MNERLATDMNERLMNILKPYKGNLSDTSKLVKWFLKTPLLPTPPFNLLGQPYIRVKSDRYFESLRRECEKHQQGEQIYGEARFVSQLQALAMMSQELAQTKLEEAVKAA